jgi:hypothetical protein
MDPIQLPSEFPAISIKILLDFVRGRTEWGRDVLAAAITVVAYGAQMAIPPKVVGSAPSPLGDPAPFETKAAEALEQALTQHTEPQVKSGIIPWALIIDYAIQLLLRKAFTA